MSSVVEQFAGLSTPTISDALDRLGIEGQCLGLRPLDPRFRVCGPAFTVQYMPCATVKGDVGDYIDDVPEGYVVALDNRGIMDCTVWGDLLSTTAIRRKIGGTVIDGVCRDGQRTREIGYPLFARGAYMRTGKGRVQADAYNVPIALGGARVTADDLIIGDHDGVLVVPSEVAEQVLKAACDIVDAEQRIRQEVQDGMHLADARAKFGYHKLQGG